MKRFQLTLSMFDWARTTRAQLLMLMAGLLCLTTLVSPITHGVADAAPSNKTRIYTPLADGDSSHNDWAGTWDRFGIAGPAQHHRVYYGYGYRSDWSVDLYSNAGRRIVTPFASRTSGGDRVISKVISVRRACASGRYADGGDRVQIEAINARTGKSLGIATIAHVADERVHVGQQLRGWTVIGKVGSFYLSRYASCYQVSTSRGTHVHFEVVQPRDYACYIRRSANTSLTELTPIGYVGVSYRSTRAAC